MLVKQRSNVVLVSITSLMCIDTICWCGFLVPPAHVPFLRPHDTDSDAPLGDVTACHCLSLLIFTSPCFLSIILQLLPHVNFTNTLRLTNGLQTCLTLRDAVEEMKNDPLTWTLSWYCDLDILSKEV